MWQGEELWTSIRNMRKFRRFGICFTHVRFIYIYIYVCVYVWYCLYNLYIWCSLAFCIHIPYTPILLAYFSAFCRCQRLTSISSTSRPLAEFDVKSPWCASIFPILSEISHDFTWFDMIWHDYHGFTVSDVSGKWIFEFAFSKTGSGRAGNVLTTWNACHACHAVSSAGCAQSGTIAPIRREKGDRRTEGPKGDRREQLPHRERSS